jgi:hypothetical protein
VRTATDLPASGQLFRQACSFQTELKAFQSELIHSLFAALAPVQRAMLLTSLAGVRSVQQAPLLPRLVQGARRVVPAATCLPALRTALLAPLENTTMTSQARHRATTAQRDPILSYLVTVTGNAQWALMLQRARRQLATAKNVLVGSMMTIGTRQPLAFRVQPEVSVPIL